MAGLKMPPGVVLCIMGPTASGKTALAERIAAELPVELVSVDSALVYRGMDIGTAKPATPHRLVDIADPSEPYSAARFRDDALREIDAIRATGRTPLLVGGTMLYFRALFRGLSALPPADPAVRAEIAERGERLGAEALHAELARIDPAAAARIHPNDPQRVQRALEVWQLTGKPISSLQQGGAGSPHDHRKLAVAPADRAELHRRIEVRLTAMLERGFLDEVARLRARGDLSPDLPALRAVGYRQLWRHLEGHGTLDEAGRRAVFATRQLAKRQLTWLRKEPGVEWLDSGREGWLDDGVDWARYATMPVR
ncbi:MAG: tRNA (adenosine(37)-N6)-dimethylallyltransferase MiaA [Gammaproteobacteria bacterium]